MIIASKIILLITMAVCVSMLGSALYKLAGAGNKEKYTVLFWMLCLICMAIPITLFGFDY